MAFYIGFYAYAIIVHTQADQLLPQLLMEQFDTFPIQCRHIEHICMKKWERSGSEVECLTRDRWAADLSLTGVTALWSLSKTH